MHVSMHSVHTPYLTRSIYETGRYFLTSLYRKHEMNLHLKRKITTHIICLASNLYYTNIVNCSRISFHIFAAIV